MHLTIQPLMSASGVVYKIMEFFLNFDLHEDKSLLLGINDGIKGAASKKMIFAHV